MVELPISVNTSLERFIKLLQQRLTQLEAVYVYGSQARGTATAWSDIDVAVISPDFAPNLFEARVMLLKLAAQVDDRIEPAPFTPQDFTATNPLASEIQQWGVRLV